MLNRKPRQKSTAPSAADPDRRLRHITGRRVGMIVLALATALTGAAITAPSASAASGCVTQTFGTWDESTYQQCVRDEQILLNNLSSIDLGVTNQLLTVDGYYGPHTFSDVTWFQLNDFLQPDGITGPQTWRVLCAVNREGRFTGVYWHDAGCATEPGP